MNTLMKKILILPLLFLGFTATSLDSSKEVFAEEETKLAYSATKITTALGEADGIKDEAYNLASPISISSVTFSKVSFSWLIYPLTVSTKFGIKSNLLCSCTSIWLQAFLTFCLATTNPLYVDTTNAITTINIIRKITIINLLIK